jgi:Protein of unknown function (DUF2934)
MKFSSSTILEVAMYAGGYPNQEISMSTTEKKPKKAAKKTAGGEEKTPAAPAVKATSTPKSGSAKSSNEAASSKSRREPSHEEVSSLAHRFFEQRGRQHGSHEQDWFRAERELAAIP